MKRITILMALFLATVAASQPCKGETKVTVSFTDESAAPVTVAVTSATKMSFGSDAMLTFAEAATRPEPIRLSEVSRITFSGDWSSVRKVAEERPSLRIVENPVGDELRLDGHDTGRPTTLTVYSIAGRQVVRISSWNGESVNVSTLPKGVYLLQADNVTLKFVKK